MPARISAINAPSAPRAISGSRRGPSRMSVERPGGYWVTTFSGAWAATIKPAPASARPLTLNVPDVWGHDCLVAMEPKQWHKPTRRKSMNVCPGEQISRPHAVLRRSLMRLVAMLYEVTDAACTDLSVVRVFRGRTIYLTRPRWGSGHYLEGRGHNVGA